MAILAIIIFTTTNSAMAIKITEVYPNPPGTDAGKEWVELYNSTPEEISLDKWIITNNKNTYSLTGTIPAHSLKQIIFTKTFLTNENTTITLQNAQNRISDQISYTNSLEGQSYSKSLTKENNTQKINWFWLTPTPGIKNASTKTITGLITTPPSISDIFYFEIANGRGKHTIKIDNNNISFDQIRASLIQDTLIKITVTTDNTLIAYQILDFPKPEIYRKTSNSLQNLQFFIPVIAILILLKNHLAKSQETQFNTL